MSGISSIEVGKVEEGSLLCERERASQVDPFIPDIIKRILGFLELTQIEEYHLSRVSRVFYIVLAPRVEGPLKLIEDCIKEMSKVIRRARDEETKELLIEYQQKLIDLNNGRETPLSKEIKLLRELSNFSDESSKTKHPEPALYSLFDMPIMQMARYSSQWEKFNKFEEWAKERNFGVPSAIFKTLEGGRNAFAREFVKALLEKGDAEGAIKVFPSIKSHFMRGYDISDLICSRYYSREHAWEALPTTFDKDFFLVYFSGKLYDLKHPKAEEFAAKIVALKEVLEHTYRKEVYRSCAVNCLFLVCKRYIRENEFEKAFALMQHLIGVAEELGLDEGASFEKVAALFVEKR